MAAVRRLRRGDLDAQLPGNENGAVKTLADTRRIEVLELQGETGRDVGADGIPVQEVNRALEGIGSARLCGQR